VTVSNLISLVLLTLREPRSAAQMMLALNWPRAARWQALVLISVLSTMVVQLMQIITGSTGQMILLGFTVSPAVGLGIGQLLMLCAGAYAMTAIGRWTGGRGDLDGAIILLTWLQVVLFTFQVLQVLLLFILPSLSDALALAAFVISFWLLTVFVAELHGFTRLGMVFLGIVATLVGLAVGLAILLSFMGIAVVGI
jgi:hypothetical protein